MRITHRESVSLLCTLLLLTLTAPAATAAPPRWETVNKEAAPFVTCLAHDPQGRLWVGTEDNGVFRYDPSADEAGQWTRFTAKDFGDDNAYAVACDKLGRVWVGTLNHGVSVYNGEAWKNYDVVEGPIGERVFAITTCPTDGDVWMATSAGLTRYSLKEDSWHDTTRADGLPEDQANALAFDAQGNLYVGTQCHGVAMAKAADDYKTWTVEAGHAQLPLTPTGTGLPTGLINGLAAARDGTVYAATNAGLAWTKDKGKTWSYLRGRDYAAKVKGRSGGAPAGWQEAPQPVMNKLLPEDYVTCVAEDDAGQIWLGFRQQGYAELDPKTRKPVYEGNSKADGLPDDYVFAILPTADSWPLMATYGGGLARVKEAMKSPGAKANAASAAKTKAEAAPLPSPAKPPTLAELQAMLKRVQGLAKTNTVGAYLSEDWTTQGDWVGRYGRQAATLCAMCAPLDHEYGWDADFLIGGRMGPHHTPKDSLRNWVHSVQTDNPRSLYTPAAGLRRQSEWDDHGEAYPQTHEGPDIWVSLVVPKGVHRIAFYLMNKDGHEGANRYRDYLLELRGPAATYAAAQHAPELARCRVRDFWGGVYKSWLVAGPARYFVRIEKNSSLNTILSAVMMDRVVGTPQPWDASWLPFMERVYYEPPAVPPLPASASPELTAARELWEALRQAPASARGATLIPAYRRLAYRAALAQDADPALLANWRWAQPLWTAQDRKEWQETMAKAWKERLEIDRTGYLIPPRTNAP